MLQRLYDWTMAKAAHPHAVWWLAIFSFAEASFFPLPADVLMVPMLVANPRAAWKLAFICGIASALGGAVGWLIGWGLFEAIGEPILRFYGYAAEFDQVRIQFQEWGIWIVAAGAITPLPYKVVTIASGVAGLNFWAFFVTSLVCRLFRFFIVAAFMWYAGPWLKRFMDNNLKLATTIFMVIFIGGFAAAAMFM